MTKEDEKITNYSPLEKEIRRMYWVSTKIVPLVVWAQCLVGLGILDVLEECRHLRVIGTTLILQQMLSL